MKAGPFLGFMAYGLRKGGLRTKPVTELTPIEGEATLDLPGSPHVIPLPGHTPGSVAIHVPSVGALFMGDGMTTRSVLTGEVGPRLGAVHAGPGGGAGVARPARRDRGGLAAARPRRRLDRRRRRGAARDPRGRREGAVAAGSGGVIRRATAPDRRRSPAGDDPAIGRRRGDDHGAMRFRSSRCSTAGRPTTSCRLILAASGSRRVPVGSTDRRHRRGRVPQLPRDVDRSHAGAVLACVDGAPRLARRRFRDHRRDPRAAPGLIGPSRGDACQATDGSKHRAAAATRR